FWGVQEKWLLSATTGTWYCLLPSGELRRGGNSVAEMMAAGSLLATLDAATYQEPSLLWNASKYGAPAVSFTAAGNTLTLSAPAHCAGTVVAEGSVSDGAAAARQTFVVTVNDTAPALGNLSSTVQAQAEGSLVYNLSAGDADGDALTLSARAVALGQ